MERGRFLVVETCLCGPRSSQYVDFSEATPDEFRAAYAVLYRARMFRMCQECKTVKCACGHVTLEFRDVSSIRPIQDLSEDNRDRHYVVKITLPKFPDAYRIVAGSEPYPRNATTVCGPINIHGAAVVLRELTR